MTIFSTIYEILSVLENLHNKEVDRFLSQKSRSSVLTVDDDNLVEINEEAIILLGKDITERIFPAGHNDVSSSIGIDRIKYFFCSIKDSLIRLNHFGIGYSCSSIENELVQIKKILHGTNFKIYEEPVDSGSQRWFFVGNLESWEYPLFELDLTESELPLHTKWIPYFQIDVDTKLTTEELETLIREHLTEDFIDWKLDIPGYGIALEMGELSNINGTKIYLGLGTDKRNTKFHREEILRLA
jgi:hypothetical protein